MLSRAVLCLLVLFVSCNAFSYEGSGVTVLTDSNFDSLVGNADTDQWFIEVYAPWCGACKKMQPVWERAATKLPPTTRVGAIDVTTNPMLEKRFTPEHYPTLMFFRAGYVYLYTGERTVKGFRAFAKEGYTSAPSARIPKAGDHAAVPQKSMVDATWDIIYEHPYIAGIYVLIVFGVSGMLLYACCSTLCCVESQESLARRRAAAAAARESDSDGERVVDTSANKKTD